MLRYAAEFAPQRLQARLINVGHAAAKRNYRFVRVAFQHVQHLIPLGYLDRTLHRARHRRHGRLRFLWRDKITGTRLRRDQLELFQRLIGLLDGTDAHPVLLAQAAHRGQLFAMAIQPLLNAFGQQIGQMLVTRHAVSLMGTIQIKKPVQIGVKKAMQNSF